MAKQVYTAKDGTKHKTTSQSKANELAGKLGSEKSGGASRNSDVDYSEPTIVLSSQKYDTTGAASGAEEKIADYKSKKTGGRVSVPYSPTVFSNTKLIEDTIPRLVSQANALPTFGVPDNAAGGGGGPAEESFDDILGFSDGKKKKKKGIDFSQYETSGSVAMPRGYWESTYGDSGSVMKTLAEMQKTSDRYTRDSISDIQSKFAQREAQQEASNLQNLAGVRQTLNLSGSSRYAPVSSQGIVSAQEAAGIRALTEIDAMERQAINEARQAQSTNDYKLLETKLDHLETVRTEKAKAIADLQKEMRESEQKKGDEINGILMEVAQNNAPKEIRAAIAAAPTVADAIDAAGEWLQTATGDGADYLFYKRDALARNQTPISAQEYFALKEQEASIGGLSKDQNTALNTLKSQMRLDPDVKGFIEVRDGYERVATGAELNNAQGDLSLLFGYMKMLDPTSVVRETEFANAEAAMGFAQKTLNIPDKVLKGNRLTEQGREDFKAAAERLYQRKKGQYDKAVDYYAEEAATYEIPKDRLIRDLGSTVVKTEDEAREKIIEMGKNDTEVRDTVIEFFNDYPEANYSDALLLFGEQTVSTNTSGNRPQRNNNPLNIKASEYTLKYPGVTGKDPKPATDGGLFLTFESPDAGFNAAKKLLGAEGYRNLTVDKAMQRWSGGGYGGDVLPRVATKKVSDLSQEELDALIRAMASREGYFA